MKTFRKQHFSYCCKNLQSVNQRKFKLLKTLVPKCCVQLCDIFIFPEAEENQPNLLISLRFFANAEYRIPELKGALDGTHISIVAPSVDEKVDHFNRKKCYNISTRWLVGANLVLLGVATGFPESCQDSHNFRNTLLYTQAENGEIPTKPEDIIANSRVRLLGFYCLYFRKNSMTLDQD